MSTDPIATGKTPKLLAAQLRQDGYSIIPGLLPLSAITALERDLDPIFGLTPFCKGNFYGPKTKRFGSLLRRSSHAATLVQHPLMLAIAQDTLDAHARISGLLAGSDDPDPSAPAAMGAEHEAQGEGATVPLAA